MKKTILSAIIVLAPVHAKDIKTLVVTTTNPKTHCENCGNTIKTIPGT